MTMEENFYQALENILKYEGGYTNHPLDSGGPTNLGITLSTLQRYYNEYGYGDFDGDGEVTVNDIKLLNTYDKVSPIYKAYYWDRLKLDEFPSGVDFLMFDFAVNSGPKNAVRILQRAINRFTRNKIDVDGLLGPNTMSYVNKINPELLIDGMLKEREIFYNKIISSDPSQEIFRRGWFNRLRLVANDVKGFLA